MDLTKPGTYPRSGRETLGGMLFLPRSIDKMRAHIAGTAGEYKALTGMSDQLFDLFGVTADQFQEAVAANIGDDGVLQWLYTHGRQPAPGAIEAYNAQLLAHTPATEERMARFRADLASAGHGDRTDVTTFMDKQDLEEGRKVPRRDG